MISLQRSIIKGQQQQVFWPLYSFRCLGASGKQLQLTSTSLWLISQLRQDARGRLCPAALVKLATSPGLIISCVCSFGFFKLNLASSYWQSTTHQPPLHLSNLPLLPSFVTWVCKHNPAPSSTWPFLSWVLTEKDRNQATSCVPRAARDGTGTTPRPGLSEMSPAV